MGIYLIAWRGGVGNQFQVLETRQIRVDIGYVFAFGDGHRVWIDEFVMPHAQPRVAAKLDRRYRVYVAGHLEQVECARSQLGHIGRVVSEAKIEIQRCSVRAKHQRQPPRRRRKNNLGIVQQQARARR